MPDPVAYLKALLAAAVASAIIVLTSRLVPGRSGRAMAAAVCVLAVSAGLATGYSILQFSWSWPPANALSRFLTLVLPVAVITELLAAGRHQTPSKARHVFNVGLLFSMVSGILRLGLYASVGCILLHRSVYLSGINNGNPEAWTLLETLVILCAGAGALILLWTALCRLTQRSVPGSLNVSLAMAILCAGTTTMLAGYIKGGAAAIPLAASLIGTTLASPLLCRSVRPSGNECFQGAIGIGVIGLFSLLWIGCFFGQLSSQSAVMIFLSPMLCWISEIPKLHLTSHWKVATVRLVAVMIPLSIVLVEAKRDFDQKMAPLLAVESEADRM